MRNTTVNSEVSVIIDGKAHKGTIVEVISQGAARIELGDKSSIQSVYSRTGLEGTYHYPDETDAVKKSATFGEPPPPPPDAAPAPAEEKKKGKK